MPIVDDLLPGAVRCAFSSAPDVTIKNLLGWGSALPEGDRVVVCEIDFARPACTTADQIILSLARAALTVWPDWYDRSDLFARCDDASWQVAFDHHECRRAADRHRSVLRPWLQRAVPLCRAANPPVIDEFASALQIQQLALAIADKDLVLVVGVVDGVTVEPADLLGLARTLEWVSQHVPARIVAVLPSAWSERKELDSITWGCRSIEEEEDFRPGSTTAANDEPPLQVGPIRGRPHPNSPGENLMATRLGRDPLLGPLFEYNMLVATVRDSRYRVDLVWFAGKLVVEIDGYRCHSSRAEFASDRHRDYELQLSGYLVLRLTHESVMDDVELAIDKIRDMVKLRAALITEVHPR